MQEIRTSQTDTPAPPRPRRAGYARYHIETETAPDLVPWPSRFRVKVNRFELAKFLLKELVHYRGDMDVILSRPCVYGVFSGPVGGFAPRQKLCVGCLRCTTQYPQIMQIHPNPERARLGDAYFTSEYVNAVAYEAEGGRIPVKGAGYRGRFGGEGWDGLWTDMSEIVRPTRDGIHGREFISTVVDLGPRPSFLEFDRDGLPTGRLPHTITLPLPLMFDVPPVAARSPALNDILTRVAREIETVAVIALPDVLSHALQGDSVVPLLTPAEVVQLERLPFSPRMIELVGWDRDAFDAVQRRFPEAVVALRIPFDGGESLLDLFRAGVSVFHLTADYHGRGRNGAHVHDLIRDAHGAFVEAGCRDRVSLIGSGGIIAAEHVPKAIIAGLDAVGLDTPALVALQARFDGPCRDRENGKMKLPTDLPVDWGVQRLKNLAAAWRDQLLEILGAMGLREVRRLRGEVGRAMYQHDLEAEAFGEIEGYHG